MKETGDLEIQGWESTQNYSIMTIKSIHNSFETNYFTFDTIHNTIYTIHITLALLITLWNYQVSIALLRLFTLYVDTLHNFFETIYNTLETIHSTFDIIHNISETIYNTFETIDPIIDSRT